MGSRSKSVKKAVSLNDSHYRFLQDLPKHPSSSDDNNPTPSTIKDSTIPHFSAITDFDSPSPSPSPIGIDIHSLSLFSLLLHSLHFHFFHYYLLGQNSAKEKHQPINLLEQDAPSNLHIPAPTGNLSLYLQSAIITIM